MDKVAWISLASRVCNGDGSLVLGNMQAAVFSEYTQYVSPLKLVGNIEFGQNGTMLLFLCLALWYFTVSNEVVRAIEMIRSLLTIPHSGTRSKFVIGVDNAIEIEAVGLPRRVCMFLLTCIRLGIAVWLLFSGGLWLCLTSNIFDLILNAAALAFVLDCDELLYSTMAPLKVIHSMKNIVPLKTRSRFFMGGLGLRGPMVLLGFAIFSYLVTQSHMAPLLQRMRDMNETMCGGDTGFVVEASKGLGYAVIVPTNTIGQSTHTYPVMSRATEEFQALSTEEKERLGGLPKHMQNKTAVMVRTQTEFFSELQKTSDSFSSHNCTDELLSASDNRPLRAYLDGLRSLTGHVDADSCADFVHLCGSDSSVGVLIRSFCSRTCRCDTLETLMIDRTGCTPACHALTQAELSLFTDAWDQSPSACFDSPLTTFLRPDVKLLLKDYERRLGVTLPLEQIQQKGCDAFSPLYKEAFSSRGSEWIPDALCGRTSGTNIAIQDVPFQTLRGLCPVSCGCSVDFTTECPLSCKKGSFRTQADACKIGACPGRQLAKGEFDDFCHVYDRDIRNGGYLQEECEALASMQTDACCCPGAVSCEGCDGDKREQCDGTRECFDDDECGFCNASEACEGTSCAWCAGWAGCAKCFQDNIDIDSEFYTEER
jgi:hypothetical protein